ncbi:MAG: hypothetical protein A2Z91_08560 [Deltaproteobacteria bacterium GWA2_38_16]|nr:MAG: hypothetical protein A2Z91_08560 [Deltaproteobacteria bacterium GWA2_38_16]OGQ03845.1 MAG: hypothetical protein A3D19_07125 [Deltaproteobacteria bacterium RIFCSPHIGHO2_02_FULL_38_15]HBQ20891.1 hypothetical protein [Deltaproteobacteria bacterium]
MKKIVFSLLFLIISLPVFSAENREIQKGFVEDMYLGEMDPFVVGDACILNVRTEDKLYGLVQADDSCYGKEQELKSLKGKWISISNSHLTTIDNKEAIRVLKEFDSEPFYLWWDGELDQVLTVSFEKAKKLKSPGLEKLRELGKKMLNEEIGGNAANVSLFKWVAFESPLSLKDAIRNLIYAEDGSEYLEEVSVYDVPANDKSLEEAAFKLIPSEDRDGWTEFRGELTDVLIDLSRETTRYEKEWRYIFFSGGLGGAFDYSTSFIAVFDRATDEVIILVQGYSE